MMVKEIVFLVEEDPEGGYNASALCAAIFAQADDLAQLKSNIKEALRCHFEREDSIPQLIRLHIVKEESFVYA